MSQSASDVTRPDVAALAAALHDDPNIGALTRRFGSFNDVWWERSAETIIAALAALGWRITSAPEDSDEASSPASGEAKSEVVTADDPVSAQAAPDMPPTKRIGDYSVLVDGLPDRVAQAAVRATLEGLRAEVAVLPESTFGAIWRGAALDLIDARLAHHIR